MNNFILLGILTAFLFGVSPELTGAAGEAVGGWGKNYKLSILAKAEVKNFKGEKIGEIEDFVMDLQSGEIALVIFSHPGMAGLGRKVKIIPFGFLVFHEEEKTFLLNVGDEDLNPAIVVKNHQGEQLGKIEDLVMGPGGRISFAVLSHKEKPILIPFGALSRHQTGSFFVLDANDEKLASAPLSKEDSFSRSQAEEIYRYFGQHPYWQSEEDNLPPLPRQTIPLPTF